MNKSPPRGQAGRYSSLKSVTTLLPAQGARKAGAWIRPKEGVAGTDAYIKRLNEGWGDGLL